MYDSLFAPDDSFSARPRVLVVDDDVIVLRALTRGLARYAEVVALDSGEAALRFLREDAAFDLVLCDVNLRGMSGLDVYAALAREMPVAASRLVLMSGDPTVPAGMRHVVKPTSAVQIMALLEPLAA